MPPRPGSCATGSFDQLQGTIGGFSAEIQTLIDANAYAFRQGLRWGRHFFSFGMELTKQRFRYLGMVSRYRHDQCSADLYPADRFDCSEALALAAMLSYLDLEPWE